MTWSRPATTRLLLEAGSVVLKGTLQSTLFGAGGEAGGSIDDRFVLDSSRNYGYGGIRSLGLNGGWGHQDFGQTNQRFSVSYVTGSHSAKVGVQYLYGFGGTDYGFPASLRDSTYVFNGTVPSAVTYYASPVITAHRQQKVGLYAQDQWTLKRLTLNLGMRFDYLKGNVPAVDVPAGTWGAGTPLRRGHGHPDLEGLDAAGGSRLRPVRQREDRQELGRGLGLNVGYFRTSYGNLRLTNNLALPLRTSVPTASRRRPIRCCPAAGETRFAASTTCCQQSSASRTFWSTWPRSTAIRQKCSTAWTCP